MMRPRRDASAWAGANPVEQHSPGLLADQKMLLLVGDGPYSFFKGEPKAPRLDLSLSPRPRPGRGNGAGPAANEGGSTGHRQIVNNNNTTRKGLRFARGGPRVRCLGKELERVSSGPRHLGGPEGQIRRVHGVS